MSVLCGEIYGRLTVVLTRTPVRTKRNEQLVLCVCQCGQEIYVTAHKLKSGHTKSCGCLQRDIVRARQTRHGRYYEPEHTVWRNMRKRCSDHRYAQWYGNVRVCDRWQNSYENFLADVGRKPTPDASLDRIDPSGHYEPSNVRWVPKHKQAHNTKTFRTNKTGVAGVSWSNTKQKWRAAIYVSNKQKHVGYFDDFNDAVAARKTAEQTLWSKI